MSEIATRKKAKLDFVRITVHTRDTMKKLSLVRDDKMVAASKERGRPRKDVDPSQPKRRPGRPRKNPAPRKARFRAAYRA